MTRKVLVNTNAPWASSGYASQAALFLPRFQKAGWDVAVSCFYGLEGGMIDWNGLPCYPADQSRFNAHRIHEYAQHHGGGDPLNTLVFTLQDVWTMMLGNPFWEQIKDLRWVSWCPVDHDPAPPLVIKFLEETGARVVAMSKHGQRMFADQGIEADYVPHGLDTSVFHPNSELGAEARRALRIPEDAYVVGMVGNNQGLPSRKAFPQAFEAFGRFAKKHDDVYLYVHADILGRNGGVNLLRLANAYGLNPDRIFNSDQTAMHLGIPQKWMGALFNTFNVLLMPSLGEGFGIPLIEAQACGVPVITTDWTAMTELCGAGWLVDGDKWWDETQATFQKVPRVGEIVDALEASYKHGEGLKERAAEFGAQFDVDKLTEDWLALLDRFNAPREIAPLKVAA